MTYDSLKDFADLVKMTNPSLNPLSEDQIASYYLVLRDIPDDLFHDKVMAIVRKKLYSFPSAGEIYETCMGKVLSEGERLWNKTWSHLQTRPDCPRHDEWDKVKHAVSIVGGVYDMLACSEFRFEKMRDAFIRAINEGKQS